MYFYIPAADACGPHWDLSCILSLNWAKLGGTGKQVGMDVSKMDGEAVVEDERTKLYSKGNNFF